MHFFSPRRHRCTSGSLRPVLLRRRCHRHQARLAHPALAISPLHSFSAIVGKHRTANKIRSLPEDGDGSYLNTATGVSSATADPGDPAVVQLHRALRAQSNFVENFVPFASIALGMLIGGAVTSLAVFVWFYFILRVAFAFFAYNAMQPFRSWMFAATLLLFLIMIIAGIIEMFA